MDDTALLGVNGAPTTGAMDGCGGGGLPAATATPAGPPPPTPAGAGGTAAPPGTGGGGGGGGSGPGSGTAAAPLRVNDETFMRATVQKTVKEVIGAEEYAHARTDGWTNDIVDNLVKNLVALDRSYKYIVTCMIVQKCGAGMRSSTQCFWNPASDIGLSVQVENPSMYVITTVFACKA